MKGKSKFGNKKVEYDGFKFDSKTEMTYYKYLKILESKGEITNIELQPKYNLIPMFKKNGETFRAINYKADFKVTYSDERVEIIDVKGFETKDFKMKRKMFEYRYEELSLILVPSKNVDKMLRIAMIE